MYYIYALIDPRTNLPFYIGKGKGNRCFYHSKYDYVRKENRHKCNIITKLKSLNLEPIVIKYEENIEDESYAYLLESLYIKYYGRKNIDESGILVNICIDQRPPIHRGEESVWYGRKHTEETIEKIKAYQSNRPQEVNDKISKSNLGKEPPNRGIPHREETKTKISKSKTGVKTGRTWNKGIPCSTGAKEKISIESKKSKWATNGKENIILKPPYTLPEGFRFGRSTGWNTHPNP